MVVQLIKDRIVGLDDAVSFFQFFEQTYFDRLEFRWKTGAFLVAIAGYPKVAKLKGVCFVRVVCF